MKNNLMNNNSMKLFSMLCGYFLSVLVLYTACQFINFRNCLGIVQVLSISIPLIIYLITLKNKKNIKAICIILCAYLFLTTFLPFLYGKTYDTTVDGNSYHKTAIAFIKNGWNPLYESSLNFQKSNSKVYQFNKKSKIGLWIDHYPKATWITAATIYHMTGNIESGKCLTLIFTVMLMIISYNCLNTILSKKWSIVVSILLALNPITLSQLFCYYVDSLMGILFAIELFLLLTINPMKKQNIYTWINIAAIASFFVNIKYTGLLSSGIIAAVFYFYWLFKYRKEKAFLKNFSRITLYFVIVFVTAIFFVGANSYVKNTIDHLNPLYPIIGKNKVDIITKMQPKSFKKRGMVEKFFISTFSKTANITYSRGEPQLKSPLKVYKSEIAELMAPDTRIGGFGPLFGIIVIVSTIIFIINLIIFLKNEKKNINYIILPIMAILLSMLLMGENWWARYVPQFYLFVIGTIIFTIYNSKYFKKEIIAKAFSIIIIFLIGANTVVFGYVNFSKFQAFIRINNNINELRSKENLKLKVADDKLHGYGYLYNLEDEDIKYDLVKEVKKPLWIWEWRIVVEQE